MRPKVLISAVAVAVVALVAVFLLPRGGSAGGSDSPAGDLTAQSKAEQPTEPEVQSPKSKLQRPAADQRQAANQPRNETQLAGATDRLAAPEQRGVVTDRSEPTARAASRSASSHNAAQKLQQDIDDQHQLVVQTRVQELLDLGMEDDSKSLQTIVSEFSNADPEIRKAAVEAAVQFGSADAIPDLENAMLWAEDAEQRQQIADAIAFLKLPKLSEAVALRPAARKATK